MKINTRQAAEKLKVGTATVIRLCEDGKLTDLATEKAKAKHRHMRIFDLAQVAALAKELKPTIRDKKNAPSMVDITADATPTASPAMGITTRLERIEQKLDHIIKLWG